MAPRFASPPGLGGPGSLAHCMRLPAGRRCRTLSPQDLDRLEPQFDPSRRSSRFGQPAETHPHFRRFISTPIGSGGRKRHPLRQRALWSVIRTLTSTLAMQQSIELPYRIRVDSETRPRGCGAATRQCEGDVVHPLPRHQTGARVNNIRGQPR
jgi:hypothetical protein